MYRVSLQIAAKIGGDGVPPMSNNGGAENYAFPAQKRSLEDGGQKAQCHLEQISFAYPQKTFLVKVKCFASSDQPDAKKMASQSDRDSALCTLNMHRTTPNIRSLLPLTRCP